MKSSEIGGAGNANFEFRFMFRLSLDRNATTDLDFCAIVSFSDLNFENERKYVKPQVNVG